MDIDTAHEGANLDVAAMGELGSAEVDRHSSHEGLKIHVANFHAVEVVFIASETGCETEWLACLLLWDVGLMEAIVSGIMIMTTGCRDELDAEEEDADRNDVGFPVGLEEETEVDDVIVIEYHEDGDNDGDDANNGTTCHRVVILLFDDVY